MSVHGQLSEYLNFCVDCPGRLLSLLAHLMSGQINICPSSVEPNTTFLYMHMGKVTNILVTVSVSSFILNTCLYLSTEPVNHPP